MCLLRRDLFWSHSRMRHSSSTTLSTQEYVAGQAEGPYLKQELLY